MTKKQKQILEVLFNGGHIVKVRPGLYSARDAKCNLIRRGNDDTAKAVFKYCKKVGKKQISWVLDKQLVLKLHGKNWVKKRYKEVRDKLLMERTAIDTLQHLQSFPVKVGFLCVPCPPMEVINSSQYKLSL